jgi:ribonuclease BN (tRNA processing enzyme)
MLLTVGENRYIVDAGYPLVTALKPLHIHPREIKGVFLTHMHGDHANGLIEFVDLLTWQFKDARPPIFVPEIDARDAIRGWLNVTHGGKGLENVPEISEVREGAFFGDGILRMTAIQNDHLPDRPSYSYLAEAEGKRVVFSGDLGFDAYSDFPKAAFEAENDLVVTEAAHCRLTDAKDVFAKIKTKKLVVSHVVPWNEPEVARLRPFVPYPVALAYDNLTVTV